jgi:voltage-gated potassium channel
MVGGIALIGVVTATLASWIVERVSLETQASAAATEEQVESLRAEVAEMKEILRALVPDSAQRAPTVKSASFSPAE